MAHEHHHHEVSGKNLLITILLNLFITLAQIVGGILSGSLALLSDALHNFSDVLSLVLAYGANRLAGRASSSEKTFGYHRAEIIATLFNASILIMISLYLIYEALYKFYNPHPIESLWVIGLGLVGVIVNGLSVFIIKDDAHSNMNFKAAYLHLIGDVLTSVAVVVGGVLMYYFSIFWIDSFITILIAIYLLWASIALLKESLHVLMQFAPKELDLHKIVEEIVSVSQVANVHHVHLWQLDDHRIHIEAHLEFKENITLKESMKTVDVLEKKLHDIFGISHATFQCEYNRCDNKEIIQNN